MNTSVQPPIRRVVRGEAELLRSVRLRALADAPEAFSTTLAQGEALPTEEWERRAANAEDGVIPTWVAVGSGEPGSATARFVGMVAALPLRDEASAELVSMWTDPDVRGMGVGRALVDTVLRWAESEELESVQLWVTDGNVVAERLYERCGFRRTADHQASAADPCRDEIRMRWSRGDAGSFGSAEG